MARVQPITSNVVNTDTVLEIGKFYNVKCAEVKNGFNHNTFCYVPVIGEKHKDPQFGVDWVHYHIDGRFSTEKDYYDVDSLGRTNRVLSAVPIEKWQSDYVFKIVVKRRKCRRLTTGLIPPSHANKYWDWYKTMVGKSCAGKKCPHLGTAMVEIEGQLICPLHSLIGNLKTNKIIMRPKCLDI